MNARFLLSLPKRWLNLVSLLLAIVGFAFVYQFTAKVVVISIDGQNISIRTHARDVGELLKDRGFGIDIEDRINVPLDRAVINQMVIEIERARTIDVEAADEHQVIRSASKSAVNILADGGIRVFPGDELWIDGVERIRADQHLIGAPVSIRLDSGRSFEVLDDGVLHNFRSSAPTVGLALQDAGVILFEGDRSDPPLTSILKEGMRVTIERARPVIIQVAGREMSIQAVGQSVGEMLINAGIPLSGMDYTIPDLEAPVPEDGRVRIVQVEEDVLVELEPLPFETVYQPIEALELDQLQVQNAGTFGVQAERVRIRYEDGEEVNRTIEEAVTVVEPESRVIGYGTKIVVRTLNTGSGTIEYWRAVPVYATSYSPCRLGVDRCGFVTAAGTGVDRGTIGVIRSWFNQMRGWPVFVPGYGPGSIQDIGAGFSDRDWIDLGFTDEEYEPWHDWTTLYFLTPVPPLDQIPWILP